MELHEVCHARRRLADELEVVLAHPVIAPLLVEFGHHHEVVDDMLRQARRPQFFAPLGSWRVAIADRPAERLGAAYRRPRNFPVRQRLRAQARELAVEWRDINGLVPYARNARTHSEAQIAQIAGSIREFGFTNPVLIDPEGGIFGQFTTLPASMIRPPSPTR